MHAQYEWIVPPGEEGKRLDRFLAERPGLGTRSRVRRLILDGFVFVDGRAVKAGSVIRAGQCVTVDRRPPATVPSAEPEAIDLDVLYENGCVLVVNKPPGLVVHPAPGHWSGTLVNALLYRWQGAPPGLDPARLGIVHRLDKDTSGAIIVAKDAASVAELGRQFHQREIQKSYLALVWGKPPHARGVMAQAIGRHPVHRKRMAARSRGRAAVTRYEVLEHFAAVTLVRAFPETGRTHQIRVHCAEMKCPIVGDATYARGRAKRSLGIRRQALHAESVKFRHPRTQRWLTVLAPLAADFAAALEELRRNGLTSEKGLSSVRPNPLAPHTKKSGRALSRARS